MRRRRNVKRNLPGLEIVSFDGSGKSSKRKLTVTTPDVVRQVETNELPVQDKDLTEEQPLQPHIVDMNNGNEGDDEGDSVNELEDVTNYRKRQQRAAQGWEGIRDAMLQAFVESELIPDGCLCTKCKTDNATFRCLKCGAGVFYCEACVSVIHSNQNVFHLVEQWQASKLVCLFMYLIRRF